MQSEHDTCNLYRFNAEQVKLCRQCLPQIGVQAPKDDESVKDLMNKPSVLRAIFDVKGRATQFANLNPEMRAVFQDKGDVNRSIKSFFNEIYEPIPGGETVVS